MARALLGCILHSRLGGAATSGRIVETEAYLGPDDLASHTATRKTGNVTAMSGPPGIAYVYRSYGIHAMLNVVAKQDGQTGAVLIRALEPLTGQELMRHRRGVDPERLLCAGPGRLCQALGITLAYHGTDLLTSNRLWLTTGHPPPSISVSGRIGITRGTEHPWRFFETGSRFVSAHRRGALLVRA